MNKKKFNYIPVFLCILLIIFFLIRYPSISIEAAKKGLLLWYNSILPSLFPFMVCTHILVTLNFFKILEKLFSLPMKFLFNLPGNASFIWLTGIISGYPVGAKLTNDLLEKKEISLNDAQHILCFANNCGPIFIIGAVGTCLLNDKNIGYSLLFIHIISSLILGILLKFIFNKNKSTNTIKKMHKRNSTTQIDIGSLLSDSIYDSIEIIIQIGGYIILFSVILSIINSLLSTLSINNTLNFFILGMIEMTNGISLISAYSCPLVLKLSIISFLLSFSGLSIHAQTASIIKNSNLKLNKYILSKFFNGVISFILSYIYFSII